VNEKSCSLSEAEMNTIFQNEGQSRSPTLWPIVSAPVIERSRNER